MPNREQYQKDKKYYEEYYQENKEKIKARVRRYKRKRKKEVRKKAREYYQENKKKVLAYQKTYRELHKDKIRQRDKEFYRKNEDKIRKANKSYAKRNGGLIWNKIKCNPEKHEKRKKSCREFARKNLGKIKEQRKIKKQQDPNFRTLTNLRTRLWDALNKYSKTGKIMSSKKYGIDYKAIIEHLKPFPEDMKKYHIDHIKPLCSFDLTNPEEVKKAFDPENHRWLLAEDNLKKIGQDSKLSIHNKK